MAAERGPAGDGPCVDLTELTLEEYETRWSLSLTEAEVRELRGLAPKLDVRPSLADGHDVTATSWIGNVRVGDLSLTIDPKVPVDRVLFLLSYALDPDAWDSSKFDYGRADRLLEAIAPGFLALMRRALEQGLRRGYRRRDEALQTVRGRVRFDEQLRRRHGRFPPAEVTYEEFTEDVPENRILLAAIERLGRLRPRSRNIRRGLRRLRSRFQGVSVVDYAARELPEITFNRLNRHYRPAIRLARLILRDSMILREAGTIQSSSFLVDMNRVFENFAVVALRESLGATARAFPQGSSGRPLWLDRDRKVALRPDLSWWQNGELVFVGDVKYKDLDERGVRSEDLYQVLAYLEATGLRRGLLIYPGRSESRKTVTVRRSGHEIHVQGWPMDTSPERILEVVRATGEHIRTWASEARSRSEARAVA